MKKQFLLLAGALACLAIVQSCGNPPDSKEEVKQTEPETIVEAPPFKAIGMPTTLANGDPFPTDSNTIHNWLSTLNVQDGVETHPNVIGHAWGLWQVLTEPTDQEYNGRTLRRYETWYTPQDVMAADKQGISLENLVRTDGALQQRRKFSFGHDAELNTAAGDIAGKVKYSPEIAQQALEGDYFDSSKIKSIAVPGEIKTLAFKAGGVMLKPIYRVLTDSNRVAENTYYFNIWGGKADGGKDLKDFEKKIYVTTNPSDPKIDDVTTYSINSFIHHRMTEAEAKTYNPKNAEGNEFNSKAKAGDPVILLGMHVATRETRRWTWQTFYWTETPDNPVFPSSATIAVGRTNLKDKLVAPADHYAASIGYSMMSPALPYRSDGPVDIVAAGVSPVYALNPYIEGTFTQIKTFPQQDSLFQMNDYMEQLYGGNEDRITSNCMSCHSQASYPNTNPFGNAFLSDQYVNRNAPWFQGSVQLDFAWSLYPGFEPARP